MSAAVTVLVDYNIEGQAALLWSSLQTEGWVDLVPMRFVHFSEVNLPATSRDRDIWHFAQAQQLVLLTANRNMEGMDSLEQTIRDSNHADALPVITIANADRIVETAYRVRCAARLVEIVVYLDDYRGSGRLYIP